MEVDNMMSYNFHLGMITNNLAALLDSFYSSHIHTNRRIELKCSSTSSNFRITEHNTNLLTKLVDKYNGTIRTVDYTCKLSHRFRHKTGMQTNLLVIHISLNLCLRN